MNAAPLTRDVPFRRVGALGGLARRRLLTGWAFLLPLVIVNGVVMLGPSLASVYYSFTQWTGLGPARWIGLGNYARMITDEQFHEALLHNLIWTAIFLTVPIAMALLGAFLLSQITRFQLLFRTLFFIPYVIASVVNAGVWENLLDPSQGVGAQLAQLHIGFLDGVAFLGSPALALFAVAFVDNWHWWGFLVVIFLAAMQGVSRDLYEAARVDGATRWRQFLHVTLPGIRPTLVFMMLMTVIWSFLVFDYVYVITQGGPAGATEVVGTLMYKHAFTFQEDGYAAAIGLSMTFVSALVTGGYLYLRRRGWEI